MKNILCAFGQIIFLFLISSNHSAAQPGSFNLTSPSNGVYANATPYFDWGNSSGANYYQLYIDGSLKKNNITTSYYQILSTEALSEGLHTWYVKAVNTSGTTQSVETWSIRIDATTPTPFNLINPADNSWTNNLQPTFQWSASSDAGSGLAKYQLWINSTLIKDNISATSTTTTPPSYYGLTNGTHSWFITAVDSVGNVRLSNEARIIKMDNLPPGNINRLLFFWFNGDYVKIPNSLSLNPTDAITLESWIYFNIGGSYNPRIISKVGSYELFLNGTGDQRTISFTLGLSNGNKTLTTSTKLLSSIWYHIAAVYDGLYMLIYINGQLDKSMNAGSGYILYNSNEINIARKSASSYDQYLGKIDEVRIWSIARSGSENLLNKNIALNGNEPGLISYWNCNEKSGAIIFDKTKNRNDGTFMGYKDRDLSPNNPTINDLCILKSPVYNFIPQNIPSFAWGSVVDSGIGFQKFQLFIDNTLKQDNLTDSAYTILSPLSYGQHTWFVKGFDLLGNNQQSPIGTFYIDNQPPNPFNLISPSDSQVVNLPTPNLSWQATNDSAGGSGLSKYQLWINGNKNIDSISTSSTMSSPSNPLQEGSYTWFIRAYDKVGNVRQSTQTRLFYVDYNPPTAFTLISPTNGDTAKVRRPIFVWYSAKDFGSGLVRYELNISGQPIVTIPPIDTSKQIPFDLPDGNYNWFVKAYDRAGSSTSSNTHALVVKVPPPPPSPILAYPPNGTNLGDDLTPDLSWNVVPNCNYFHVQVSRDSNFTILAAENNNVLTLNWTPVLNFYSKYYWRVKAHSLDDQWSNWSETRSFTISLGVPVLYSPLNGSINQDTTINLVWFKSTSPSTFKLQVAADSNFSLPLMNDSTVADTVKTISGFNYNTKYYWHVKAKNSAGESNWSVIWNFITKTPTGIANANNEIPFTYNLAQNYPNPFNPSTKIKFALPERANVKLTVYNLLGEKVVELVNGEMEAGYHESIWNASGFASGIYFYRLQANEFVEIKKLILIK